MTYKWAGPNIYVIGTSFKTYDDCRLIVGYVEFTSDVIGIQKVIRPRLELRTFCVLDRCDNQLRHRTDDS